MLRLVGERSRTTTTAEGVGKRRPYTKWGFAIVCMKMPSSLGHAPSAKWSSESESLNTTFAASVGGFASALVHGWESRRLRQNCFPTVNFEIHGGANAFDRKCGGRAAQVQRIKKRGAAGGVIACRVGRGPVANEVFPAPFAQSELLELRSPSQGEALAVLFVTDFPAG